MKGIKALRISTFVRVWLTIFLALWFLVTFSGAASPLLDSEPGPGERTPPKPPEISKVPPLFMTTLALLSKKGYGIVGPVQVIKIESNSLSLFTLKKEPDVLDLNGKQLAIKNSENKDLLLSEIQQFSKIYICRKGNEVIILVLPAKENKNA
ncbi:hypothetical protein [Desulfomonile tiedjei]|uniref:Uncharacterized protein n=1 Tax=Desulfomonile tiedjei (strain ATCC 49306 / DSM 6799 / DCB-1) TaxID=706587 RepID=I4CAI2_DESTA|nr:hypothetical protein [Desulfomonile tiedjei]AFM26573.1 hypothetical protein Desti_3931 [Desulfomonile tiedjei DSM 6799]